MSFRLFCAPPAPGRSPGSHPRRWAASLTAEPPPLGPDQEGGRARRAARRAARGRGRRVPRPPPAACPPHPVASGLCGPACRQPRERGACPVVECRLHSGPFRRRQHHPVVFHPGRGAVRCHARRVRQQVVEDRLEGSAPSPSGMSRTPYCSNGGVQARCRSTQTVSRSTGSGVAASSSRRAIAGSPSIIFVCRGARRRRTWPGSGRPRSPSPARNPAPQHCLVAVPPLGPRQASSTPVPGSTAEWSYLDTRPFSNDCTTP
ncbi:hypothetical protein SAMN02787118_102897 [Streptomyces mirabilis]|uniref:Uncharacterized protein n=1 Tax=Streptomyces mirabilis TaxID=68239 RepID=A0A1I2DZ57_9ACTN|nr:hypothetical protein SAMN02787118_102897 [Streptomyces mirabilis]